MDLRPVIDLVNIDTDKKDPSWVPPGKRKNGKRKNEEENQAKQNDVQNQDDVDEQDEGVSDPENHQDHLYSREDEHPEFENMTLLRLERLSCYKKGVIDYLQYCGVFLSRKECPKCQAPMVLSLERQTWRCYRHVRSRKGGKKVCGKEVSIRKHTLFSQSRLSVVQILQMVYLLILNFDMCDIERELKINHSTLVSFRTYVRQVLAEWSWANSKPIGGDNKVVEIDETKFTNIRFNYMSEVTGCLAFCGIERDTGKMFMMPIPNRNPETLHAVIKKWVLPKTRVLVDVWKPSVLKKKVDDLELNHKLTFVDPKVVPNTSGIEPTVRHAKTILPHYNNRRRHYPGYMSQYMFFKYCKVHDLNPFETFIRLTKKIDFDARGTVS